MLIDTRSLATDQDLAADVVIVGGGLAGLTLAGELAGRGARNVLILESGGTDADPRQEELNRGGCTLLDGTGRTRTFDAHLIESRCRRLGGSGWLWGGKSAELDPIDFETRRWIAHSGWPFTYDELKPYVNRACDTLGIPHFRRNAVVDPTDPRTPLIVDRDRTVRTAVRRFSAIAGRATDNRLVPFIERVTGHPAITTCLYATVNQIDTRDGAVASLQATAPNGRRIRVRGRHYVLAAGGLENARLLLASAIGNEHDLVGRFFMGHAIHRRTAAHHGLNRFVPAVPPSQLALYVDKNPAQPQGVFQLTANTQRRERVPNCTLTLEPETTDGPLAAYYMLEQRPNPESRVLLTDEVDSMRLPRIQLRWQFLQQDFADLRRVMTLFADEFARHGVGRLEQSIDTEQLLSLLDSARHHIGTTRMHPDPAHGVVDGDCRVHSMKNLFVSGTSVFPTSGVSNPTLTIISLAIRLADHLASGLEHELS